MKDITGQISLFDFIAPQDNPYIDPVEKYLEEVILHETAFSGGKKRIYELYQSDMTSTDRAKRIKDEYGLGGAGWPLEGYGLHGYDTFHNGLRIEWRDEKGNHEKVFDWKRIEMAIQKLVVNGKYYQA